MPEVITAGDLFTDLLLSGFDAWPKPGREVFAQEFAREAGGGAAITACGLAKLGTQTQIFGMVGLDDHEWLLGRLRTAGADVSAIHFHQNEPTAFTIAATIDADRSFLTYPGANRGFLSALLDAAERQEFRGVRHVHLACAPDHESAPGLLRSLHAQGCTVSLDCGWHPEWLADSRMPELLANLDLFFPNEPEALHVSGAKDWESALQWFERQGVPRVALKRGAHGAALLWEGSIYQTGPVSANVLETTGAGDCFDAGFLYGWLTGRSPQTCLRAGAVCGALSTEAPGGLRGFPSPETLWGRLGHGD